MNTTASPPPASEQAKEHQRDLLAFIILTVILVPILAIAVVGGFGFVIWTF